MSAPAGSKKKGKKKGKTLNLNDFLAGSGPAPGSAFVTSKSSWADEVDGDNPDVSNAYIDSDLPTRVQLPTAPRSSQPIELDMSTLPDNPPFTVYLGNIPFDCSEEEITNFLKQCSVSNVRIPSDTDGRFKGFCYAEVDDLESLRTALSLNDESMRNRRIKVDLATTDNRGGDRMDQYDRTQDDWRKPSADDRGGRGGDNQEWGRGREDGGRGGWDRDRGGPDRRDRPTPDEESTDWRKDQKAPATGGFQDRRGGFNDQGGYNDRRGGYEDRRGGGYDDRRGGGFDDRRGGGYDDRRGGGYDDRRGGYDNRRGYGDDRRGGGYERRGYDDQRGGGYDDRRGGGGGGGYNDRRGGGYDDRRGGYPERREGDSEDSGEPRRSDPAGGEPPKERKRLVLTKRTQPVEPAAAPSKSGGGGGGQSTASIFGGAKPVDTTAREKEIEERLRRDREAAALERRRVEGDREINRSQRPERTRTESETSSGHEGRTRHSSSGSGRSGPRPVMIRRESERSTEEDAVFHKDDPTSPVSATSPIESTSPRSPKSLNKDDPKVVSPAPPPKQNAWARKSETVVSPRTGNSQPRTSSSSDGGREPPTSPKGSQDEGHSTRDRRSSGEPRGGVKPGPRRLSDPKKDKPPPKKPAELPKFEEPKPKDWTEKNMFSGLDESED